MGKKTSEFMNSIKKLERDLMDSLSEVVGVCETYKSSKSEYEKLFDEHEKITAKFMPDNKSGDNRHGNKVNPEKALAADPEFKKVEASITRVQKQMEDLMDWRDTAKKKLATKSKELEGTVDKFKDFVAKKKSSWTGSKKSVPEAEALIKEAFETVGSIQKVVKAL